MRMLILGFEPFDLRDDFWPKPPAPGFNDNLRDPTPKFPVAMGRADASHVNPAAVPGMGARVCRST